MSYCVYHSTVISILMCHDSQKVQHARHGDFMQLCDCFQPSDEIDAKNDLWTSIVCCASLAGFALQLRV